MLYLISHSFISRVPVATRVLPFSNKYYRLADPQVHLTLFLSSSKCAQCIFICSHTLQFFFNLLFRLIMKVFLFFFDIFLNLSAGCFQLYTNLKMFIFYLKAFTRFVFFFIQYVFYWKCLLSETSSVLLFPSYFISKMWVPQQLLPKNRYFVKTTPKSMLP